MREGRVCIRTFWTSKKPLCTHRKPMEYHEKQWDTRQDGESDSRHLHGF